MQNNYQYFINGIKINSREEYFAKVSCGYFISHFDEGCVFSASFDYKRNKLIVNNYLKDFVKKVGEVFKSKQGDFAKIVNYISRQKVSIIFEDGTIIHNVRYGNLKKGSFKNPNRSCRNKGFFGIGKYVSSKNNKINRSDKVWRGMMNRCYCEKEQDKRPSYKGCSVAEEWHNFQNFAKWYEDNWNPETMKGWHLDKDILVKGNKIYSPETCRLVPPAINGLFLKKNLNRGNCPIGVSFNIKDNKYRACIMKDKRITLGRFKTPEEAFKCYKLHKEAYIKEVADKWKDLIDVKVYEAMYNYKVEITD
jgi:hypothetical protein